MAQFIRVVLRYSKLAVTMGFLWSKLLRSWIYWCPGGFDDVRLYLPLASRGTSGIYSADEFSKVCNLEHFLICRNW